MGKNDCGIIETPQGQQAQTETSSLKTEYRQDRLRGYLMTELKNLLNEIISTYQAFQNRNITKYELLCRLSKISLKFHRLVKALWDINK